MNAVESLLTRLQLTEIIPSFREANIDKVVALRGLDDAKMKELVPDDAQRQKLVEALKSRGNEQPRMGPPAIHTGPMPPRYIDDNGGRGNGEGRGRGGRGRGGNFPREGGAPRQVRVCRQFFSPNGCKFGESCKYSHDSALYAAENEGAPRPHDNIGRESYKESIVVPSDSVKLLLGNKAKELTRINQLCGTTNSKIERPPEFSLTYTFDLHGTPENVAKAKSEVLKFVGVTSQQEKEARFQYANHELEHNAKSVQLLCASNIVNADTGFALSEAVLKRVVSTFRFEQPPKITHLWTPSTNADKEKFEIITKLLPHFKGIQTIVFTEHNRVVEMAKAPHKTARAFNVGKAQFVHRELTKEQRMTLLEEFKKGEDNEHGVKQRVLVTTNDYAKYARKVLIPYVNFVVHFCIPKSKEIYLHQAMTAGRKGTDGLSLLFVTPYEIATQKEWSAALPLEELDDKKFAASASSLQYDTVSAPLTDEAADPADDWRDALKKEMEEKAAKKAMKQANKA